MHEHHLFYFPYGSFTDAQMPLLKVAALFFDKLLLLDPVAASWNTIGADASAREAVQTLDRRKPGLLETVNPAEVLERYGGKIAMEVEADVT
jgi:hypothetical protein